MNGRHPHLVILTGPNGAGKTTAAPYLLKGALGVTEFVNADTVAQGLSAFEPEKAAIPAGRVMLKRIDYLAGKKEDFAFETTLSTRSYTVRIRKWRKTMGYRCHLVFLWLPGPELAIERIRTRVLMGGHHIPEAVIWRRYASGIINFFRLYRPLVHWYFYDCSETPRIIARGEKNNDILVQDRALWDSLKERYL